MAKRRKFTAKFKAEVVLEALRGETSQAELCRRHNLSENQVSTWKRQLLENAETFFASATDKVKRVRREDRSGTTCWPVDAGLGNPKKSIDLLGLTSSQQRRIVEALHTEYSILEKRSP